MIDYIEATVAFWVKRISNVKFTYIEKPNRMLKNDRLERKYLSEEGKQALANDLTEYLKTTMNGVDTVVLEGGNSRAYGALDEILMKNEISTNQVPCFTTRTTTKTDSATVEVWFPNPNEDYRFAPVEFDLTSDEQMRICDSLIEQNYGPSKTFVSDSIAELENIKTSTQGIKKNR